VPAVLAAHAQKAVKWDAAAKERLDLVEHEGGQFAAAGFKIRQESRPVLLHGPVQQGRFGAVAFEGERARVSVTACCWLRGRHQQEFSATGRYWLLAAIDLNHSDADIGGRDRTPAC
jgi:hypothetical protein